jgi:hypothetical protein
VVPRRIRPLGGGLPMMWVLGKRDNFERNHQFILRFKP